MPAKPPPASGLSSLPMELHASSAGAPHFAIAGKGQKIQGNYRPGESETLKFLSREERECIMFLEETIDSLDHELQDPVAKRSSGHNPSAGQRSLSPKEQDIIDLVQIHPHHTKDVLYNPRLPDFQAMGVQPESHFEMRGRHGTAENFPYDFKPRTTLNPSVPAENLGSTSHSMHHPAGLVPTPVVIAQRIAEKRKPRGAVDPPAVFLDRSRSLDRNGASPSPDHTVKQPPPTETKSARYPGNINFFRAKKDVNHGITAPSVQELKAQVLTNLTVQHDLEQTQAMNIPNRSSSYRDPDPEKSRMEALSKLGLTADHPSSAKWSTPTNHPVVSTNQSGISVNSITFPASKPEPVPSAPGSASKTDTSANDFNSFGGKSRAVAPLSSIKHNADIHHLSNFESRPYTASTPSDSTLSKIEVSTNSFGGKSRVMTPSPSIKHDANVHHLSNFENGPPAVSPSSGSSGSSFTNAEVSTNSYGGKSKVMSSTSSIKHDPTAHHLDDSESLSTIVSHSSDSGAIKTEVLGNSYGGKTKVMIPASSVKREVANYSDEHDGIPSIMTYSSNTTEALNNSYGGKSKVIGLPLAPSANTVANIPAAKLDTKVPERTPRSQANASSSRLDPRPQETPVASQENVAPLSTVEQNQSISKPKSSFRTPGVTVQFSGRGVTDQTRIQALRDLGLLK